MVKIFCVTMLFLLHFLIGFAQTGNQLRQLAALAWKEGDFEKAISYSEQQLPLTKSEFGVYSKQYEGNLVVLGYLYMESYVYNKAAAYYLEASTIQQKLYGEDSEVFANSLFNAGLAYSKMNLYDKAELYVNSSFNIYDRILDPKSYQYLFQKAATGNFYAELALYGKAEKLLLESQESTLKVFGANNDRYVNVTLDLAILYDKMGLSDKAEKLFLKAEKVNSIRFGDIYKSDSLQLARGLMDIGTFYLKLGNLKEAEPRLIRAEKLTKEYYGGNSIEFSKVCKSLSDLFVAKGELRTAYDYLMSMLYVINKSAGGTGILYGRGVYKVAEIDEKRNDTAMVMSDLTWSMKIYLKHLKEQAGFLSEMEFSKYLDAERFQRNLYYSLYHRHSSKAYGKKATGKVLGFVTFNNGLQLRSSSNVRKAIFSSNDTLLMKEYDRWNLIKLQIAKQNSKPTEQRSKDLTLWEENANTIEKNLTRATNMKDSIAADPFVIYRQLRSKLQGNKVLVEFLSFQYYNGTSWTDSTLYAALLLRSTDSLPIYIPLFEERQLKGLLIGDSIRTFANLLYTDAQIRNVEHDISYGDSLYKLIWKPLEGYFNNIAEIGYTACGLLHNLNCDAIPCKSGVLLSDKYKLQRLTSITNIEKNDLPDFTPASISLFGGIIYDLKESELKKMDKNLKKDMVNEIHFSATRSLNDTLSRGAFNYLAGSKIEIENIEKLFLKNKISTSVYSEQFGSEYAVKNLNANNSPSIIHFSTHGYFFPDPEVKKVDLNKRALDHDIVFKYSDNPLFRSGLIMAGAEYVWKGNPPLEGVEDGILTAFEVSNLYLPNTKLVVMSACETGLGDIKGSEGVYGLQRAFKMAGVDYIIMTLWQVLDKETSDFMTLFYQNLLDKRSIPDAFKITQDFMKNKYRDEPYKWAGFVLIK